MFRLEFMWLVIGGGWGRDNDFLRWVSGCRYGLRGCMKVFWILREMCFEYNEENFKILE